MTTVGPHGIARSSPQSRDPVFSLLILATTLLLTPASALRADDSPLHPSGLRCESLTNPTGIDETAPRLSWIDESPRRAERQTAYQILVASAADTLRTGRGDLWDSGTAVSAESAHVVYSGQPLVPRSAGAGARKPGSRSSPSTASAT